MNENELIARLTKVEKQFNKALHKALFMNIRLKRWVTKDDLKQDVLLRMVRIIKEVDVQSDTHFLRLLLLQLRRSIIGFHRKLYGPNGWALNLKTDPNATKQKNVTDDNLTRMMISAGAPVTIEEWIDFHESVDLLPEIEKSIFELFFYGGLTDYEVAKIIGCSDRTVRRHFKSARETLQSRIDERKQKHG